MIRTPIHTNMFNRRSKIKEKRAFENMARKKVVGTPLYASEVSPLVLVGSGKNRNLYFLKENHIKSNTVTLEPEPAVRKHYPSPNLEEEEFGNRPTNVSHSIQAFFETNKFLIFFMLIIATIGKWI